MNAISTSNTTKHADSNWHPAVNNHVGLSRRNYQEKRDFIRMRIHAPVIIECIEANFASHNVSIKGVCCDLSGNGMLIQTEEDLMSGQQVNVTVLSSDGVSKMLKAQCEVARIHSGPNQSIIVGLAILQILEELETD